MKKINMKWNVRGLKVSFYIFTLLSLIWSGTALSANKKEEEKKENQQYTVSGSDPKAFCNAAALFSINDQSQLNDETAEIVLTDLEKSSENGIAGLAKILEQLTGLKSVKFSPTNIRFLEGIAEKIEIIDQAPSKKIAAVARGAFEQGNKRYEAGEFSQAIESYGAVLRYYPAFWDAWNNMALAQMHSNNDLAAFLLLSILNNNNPKYVGASINLSVCLERLGQNTAAYFIAETLAAEQPQMPMAQYNMAWFENARGKYASAADYISKSLSFLADYSVAKWLDVINTMESGRDITAEQLKSLPVDEQTAGIPKIISKQVTAVTADAYNGDEVVTEIPKGSKVVISEEAGNYCALYWPVINRKHRLWIEKASLKAVLNTTDNNTDHYKKVDNGAKYKRDADESRNRRSSNKDVSYKKGLFLRFMAGLGFSSMKFNYNTNYEAMGGLFHFQIGAEISENLVIFGDIGGFSLSDPKANGYQFTDTTIMRTSLGIGLSYYIMPANMHFSGSILMGQSSITISASEGTSKWGPGVFLCMGKEWRSGKRWGLGAAGFFELGKSKDQGYLAEDITNQIIGIAFTATKH
jgi:hypothetical protein